MDSWAITKNQNTDDRIVERANLPLTFDAVDGVAFAATKGKLNLRASKRFTIDSIGPFLELFQLEGQGVVPCSDGFTTHLHRETAELKAGLQRRMPLWFCSSKQSGFLRTLSKDDDLTRSLHFGSQAERAAITAGFSKEVAAQLAAAILEMIDNIYLHSRSVISGLAVFKAKENTFEFTVLDSGTGILRSLRQCSEYASLSDHGDALQLALTDGCSRFGSGSKHGHGFRPLFIGLSNLKGSLRFRSGDHALVIDGTDPKGIPWTKIAKPEIGGFLASVCCCSR